MTRQGDTCGFRGKHLLGKGQTQQWDFQTAQRIRVKEIHYHLTNDQQAFGVYVHAVTFILRYHMVCLKDIIICFIIPQKQQ